MIAHPLLPSPASPASRRTSLPQLLARLRELGRVAAAIDGAGSASEGRQRLLGPKLSAGDRAVWCAEAGATAAFLLGELEAHGVTLHRRAELATTARAAGLAAFRRDLLPLTTPLTLDAAHPLPRARLRGFVVAATLRGPRPGRETFRLLPLPPAAARWVPVEADGALAFAPAEELLRLALADMYGDELVATHVLRVIRDAAAGTPTDLEHEPGAPDTLLARCLTACGLPGPARPVPGLLGLADLPALCDAVAAGL